MKANIKIRQSRTGSKAKRQKANVTATSISDQLMLQKESNASTITTTPGYSSMMAAIEKIKHPVSLKALKSFYGMK